MNLHIEHIESDNGPVTYWHVQRILFTEAALTAARGVAPNLGLELVVPLRLVRSRIRYEDLAGQPFTPVPPDVHHRNETLTRVSDPRLLAHFGTVLGAWSIGARAGASIPVGRTEPNPFELGRLGLPHQHIQFGTGTWDPILSAGVGRSFGRAHVELGAYTKLSLYENAHGYQAGNLYNGSLSVSRNIAGLWGGFLGANLTREEAERWSGRLEEEGNLGRHDATLSIGVGRPVASVGSFALTTTVPIHTEVKGEQADAPIVFSLGWSYP